MQKFLLDSAVVMLAWGVGLIGTSFGQNVVIGKKIAASQRISMDKIDHSAWDNILQKYVNEKGQVDYQALKQSKIDSQLLDGYLSALSSVSTTTPATRNGQLAYWINAYNAVTVKGILREYPTSSIRNHTARLIGYNIWKNLLLQVGDKQVSLDSIEHKILRPMGEPRIHFAIVCASHSCPRLLNRAFVASKLEDQLTLNTKTFFANSENFKFDQAKKKFQISAIIRWFGDDFGPDQAARLKYLSKYLPTKDAQAAAKSNSVGLSFLEYDWSLNEVKGFAR